MAELEAANESLVVGRADLIREPLEPRRNLAAELIKSIARNEIIRSRLIRKIDRFVESEDSRDRESPDGRTEECRETSQARDLVCLATNQ